MRSIGEAVPAEVLSASLYKISLPPGRDVRGEGHVGDARGLRRSRRARLRSGRAALPARHIPSRDERSSEPPIVGRERERIAGKPLTNEIFCRQRQKIN